jgi:hypothetical protein
MALVGRTRKSQYFSLLRQEVSEAKLAVGHQARDVLLKARVSVHTFRDTDLQRDTDARTRGCSPNLRRGREGPTNVRAIIASDSPRPMRRNFHSERGLRLYITVLEKK